MLAALIGLFVLEVNTRSSNPSLGENRVEMSLWYVLWYISTSCTFLIIGILRNPAYLFYPYNFLQKNGEDYMSLFSINISCLSLNVYAFKLGKRWLIHASPRNFWYNIGISARCASSRSVLCDRNFLSHKKKVKEISSTSYIYSAIWSFNYLLIIFNLKSSATTSANFEKDIWIYIKIYRTSK